MFELIVLLILFGGIGVFIDKPTETIFLFLLTYWFLSDHGFIILLLMGGVSSLIGKMVENYFKGKK